MLMKAKMCENIFQKNQQEEKILKITKNNLVIIFFLHIF